MMTGWCGSLVVLEQAREQGRAGLYLHPLVVRPDLFGSLMPRELTMSRYVVVGQVKRGFCCNDTRQTQRMNMFGVRVCNAS